MLGETLEVIRVQGAAHFRVELAMLGNRKMHSEKHLRKHVYKVLHNSESSKQCSKTAK